VDVFNAGQLNQPVFLNAGQMTSIRAQQLPRPPGVFKTGRNDDLFRTQEMRGNQPGRGDNGRVAQGGQRPDNGSNPQGGQRPPDINDRSRQPGGTQPPPQAGKPGGGRRP
jgi:hypothetical protein